MRLLTAYVLGLLLFSIPTFAQELTGEVLEAIHEKMAREMERNFHESSDSVVIAEEEAWTEYFRTSELEGEDAVGYNSGLARPEGIRIGAVCMDGSRVNDRGRGACGGYGGVRFWVYQVNEDSVVFFPTSRHRQHPEPPQ